MSKANQNSNVANRLSVANSTERLASIGVRNGETLLQRDTGALYTWLDTVWAVAGETPVTATPILSGVATAESEAVIEITIDNYDVAAVCSELTVSGGSAERVDDVITWTLPTAEEDDTFTISIKAKEAGSLISLPGSHLITITAEAITDTPTLNTSATDVPETAEYVVTITNWGDYTSPAVTTKTVESGSFVDNEDGTLTYTAPVYTGSDDEHIGTIKVTDGTDNESLAATITFTIKDIVTADAIVHTGGTLTATQIPVVNNVDLSGNTALAEAIDTTDIIDSASSDEFITSTVVRDGDIVKVDSTDMTASGVTIESGSELVTNGTFDTDLTGWTDQSSGSGTVSVVSSQLNLDGADSSNRAILNQSLTTVIGRDYVVTFDVIQLTGDYLFYSSGSGQGELAITSTGSKTIEFTATTTSHSSYWNAFGASVGIIDNVSVMAINTYTVDTTVVTSGGTPSTAYINQYGGESLEITVDSDVFTNLEPVITSTAKNYTISAGATTTSVTITGATDFTVNDTLLMAKTGTETLLPIDTTSITTDNGGDSYTFNLTGLSFTVAPKIVAKNVCSIRTSVVPTANPHSFSSRTPLSYVADDVGGTTLDPDGDNNTSTTDYTPLFTTDNTEGDFTVTVSSFDSAPYDGWKALDSGVTGGYGWQSASVTTGTFDINMDVATVINKIIMVASVDGTRTPKDFTIRGSTDGFSSSNVELRASSTETGWSTNESRELGFTNGTAYPDYRIDITTVDGAAIIAIQDLKFIEVEGDDSTPTTVTTTHNKDIRSGEKIKYDFILPLDEDEVSNFTINLDEVV